MISVGFELSRAVINRIVSVSIFKEDLHPCYFFLLLFPADGQECSNNACFYFPEYS